MNLFRNKCTKCNADGERVFFRRLGRQQLMVVVAGGGAGSGAGRGGTSARYKFKEVTGKINESINKTEGKGQN